MKFLLALLLTSSILYSQNDSVYKFTLPELKITQLEKGKEVIYGFDNDENLFLVKDSMLVANPDKYKYKVLMSAITKLSIRDGTYSWRGAKFIGLIGGGMGLLFGAGISAIYSTSSSRVGIIIVIPAFTLAGVLFGGIIGGVLGGFMPYFENYSKFSEDAQAKKEILKRIFKKHNLK